MDSFRDPCDVSGIWRFGERRDGTSYYDLWEGIKASTRSVEEVMASHDFSWMKDVEYHVITDEVEFERVVSDLEALPLDHLIAYDTETTGLYVNAMGKRKSGYEKMMLDAYNSGDRTHYLLDRMVCLIFSYKVGQSFVFMCGDTHFHNLYELSPDICGDAILLNIMRERRAVLIDRIIDSYKSDPSYGDPDLRRYFLEVAAECERRGDKIPYDGVDCDLLVMERLRTFLETHAFVGANVGFDWMVSHLYGIDPNFVEDVNTLANMLFKYGGFENPMGPGQVASLKKLTRSLVGVDQADLDIFFPEVPKDGYTLKTLAGGKNNGRLQQVSVEGLMALKAEKDRFKEHKLDVGRMRAVDKLYMIDFSLFETTDLVYLYAPADGDMTLRVCNSLHEVVKREGFEDQLFTYGLQVMADLACAYASFYGLCFDIDGIRAEDMHVSVCMPGDEYAFYKAIGEGSDAEDEFYASEYYQNVRAMSFIGVENGEAIVNECLKKAWELRAQRGTGLNLDSPKQMSEFYYDVEKAPPSPKSKPRSVDGEALEFWAKCNPMPRGVKELLHFKDTKSAKEKFYTGLVYAAYPGGFIFPGFNVIGAATGRMSSAGPNAQQFPPEVSKHIIARPGFEMLDSDYSQIELRVMAAMAKDEEYMRDMGDPEMDCHRRLASILNNVNEMSVTKPMRNTCKSLNFAIPYGMSTSTLRWQLFPDPTYNKDVAMLDTKKRYDAYFREQPYIREFFDGIKSGCRARGIVNTYFGWRRAIDIDRVETVAVNTVIQGTAAEIFKIGLCRLFEYIRRWKLFGLLLIVDLIHDEQVHEASLALDIRKVVAAATACMNVRIEGFPRLWVACTMGDTLYGAKKEEQYSLHSAYLQRLHHEFPLTEGPWLDSESDRRDERGWQEFLQSENDKFLDTIYTPSRFLLMMVGSMTGVKKGTVFGVGLRKLVGDDLEKAKGLVRAYVESHGLVIPRECIFDRELATSCEVEVDSAVGEVLAGRRSFKDLSVDDLQPYVLCGDYVYCDSLYNRFAELGMSIDGLLADMEQIWNADIGASEEDSNEDAEGQLSSFERTEVMRLAVDTTLQAVGWAVGDGVCVIVEEKFRDQMDAFKVVCREDSGYTLVSVSLEGLDALKFDGDTQLDVKYIGDCELDDFFGIVKFGGV